MSSKDPDKIVRSFRNKMEELEDTEGASGSIVNRSVLTEANMGRAEEPEKRLADRKLMLSFRSINYAAYEQPNGWLVKDKACHALWHYYLFARRNYEAEIIDPQILEGQEDPKYNYRQVFKSIARQYGVEPERMVKFWANVDMQAQALLLPLLPKEERYRFDSIPEV